MLAPLISILGQAALPLLPHLLRYAHQKAIPAITDVLSDPSGYASRIGDLLVWNGSSGQHVLAGLQTLEENEKRIEGAVTSIEAAQTATSSAVGALQTVGMATLGITSLTGGLMLWRLNALNKRFDRLSQQVQDLDDNMEANNKAHLRTAIQELRAYDDGDAPCLQNAMGEAQHAVNIYSELVDKEAGARQPRLDVLNYRGRCYLLSLLTYLRTRMLEEKPDQVIVWFDQEQKRLENLAKATFVRTIRDSPAPFLASATKEEGVSLDLMTEIYQHAGRLGAFTETEIRTSSDMFEYCRAKGISGRPTFKWTLGDKPKELSRRLKFLMACFEDIGRVESLKLLAKKIKSSSIGFTDLQTELRTWQDKEKGSHPPESVFAYSFS